MNVETVEVMTTTVTLKLVIQSDTKAIFHKLKWDVDKQTAEVNRRIGWHGQRSVNQD